MLYHWPYKSVMCYTSIYIIKCRSIISSGDILNCYSVSRLFYVLARQLEVLCFLGHVHTHGTIAHDPELEIHW